MYRFDFVYFFDKEALMSRPANINHVEWELALSLGRSICADFFKKGGTPADALTAYGTAPRRGELANWKVAIETIAVAHCQMNVMPCAA